MEKTKKIGVPERERKKGQKDNNVERKKSS